MLRGMVVNCKTSPARPPRASRKTRFRGRSWVLRGALLSLALAAAGCASRPGPGLRVETLEDVGWRIAERPCDAPERVDRKPQPNPHDPRVTDEVIETRCPGWVTTVYVAKATQPPKLLPVGVQLTSKHPLLPEGLQVGTPASKVRELLGAPTVRDPAALAYRMGADRPDGDVLRFIVRGDKVAAIEWAWYID